MQEIIREKATTNKNENISKPIRNCSTTNLIEFHLQQKVSNNITEAKKKL